MRSRLFVVVLLLAGFAGAQVRVNQQMQVERSGQGNEPAKPPLTKEELKRGQQMLQMAEMSAQGMDGAMRAYGLLQVAHAYAVTDRKKALTLLDQALAATHALDNDNSQAETRDDLQEQILQAMIPLDPSQADQSLDQVGPGARSRVLGSLLSYYQKQKDWDRAIQMIYRIAPQSTVPYDAVGRLMASLPPERSGDSVQLFATALSSFENHPPAQGRMTFGNGDFSSLILSTWKTLPREMVLEAVDAVLSQAKKPADSGSSDEPKPMSVSMASANGAVQFNSIYEFRLFQLLPVLKQLDPSKADDLVKQDQAVQAALKQYPEGVGSVAPNANGSASSKGAGAPMMSMMVGAPGGKAGGPAPSGMSPLLMHRMAQIVEDAAKHPDDALANAATIPDSGMRLHAYMGIAQVCAKKHSDVAHQALEKVMDGLSDLDLTQQVMTVNSAAKMYLELEDTASAKKAIEKGMTIADKAYKQDTNSDDPNKALKAYWPSAEAYRGMLRLAAKISPVWSLELLKDISDPEMKSMGEIALAKAFLDVPPGATTIMTDTKHNNSVMKSMP